MKLKNSLLGLTFSFLITMQPQLLAEEKPTQGLEISLAKYSELEESGNKVGAFNVAYLMAQKGDDRAQFIVGAAYANGIPKHIEPDYVKAYAWMILSTSKRNGIGRKSAIRSIKKALGEDKLKQAELLAANFLQQYESGKRILSPIIITKMEQAEQDKKSCNQTGTKIKTNCSNARSHLKFDRN
ncbi:hypothetical protein FLL45_14275 [Aliikangiella marina]|uniref:Sel1 repeat family protein n=1 Tax=Aliikangiella marina TaxID=1712262 RepID=A0A545T9Y0_9GAMM|nr:hypothetical protein [Aliikangiella marina]TQV74022.1 hypothetical protein FLL45_14275 [Aliikangiella marina]